MDVLKSLVDSKKRALEGPRGGKEGPKKWKRRGELSKPPEAAESQSAKRSQDDTPPSGRQLAKEVVPATESDKAADEAPGSPEAKTILSRAECFTRLRALGQPITLFAETDKSRHIRTMKAQAAKGVLEEDMHEGQRNDYLRDIENRGDETKGSAFDIDKADEEEEPETPTSDASRKPKKTLTLEQVIIDWIKAALKEWDRHLEARSDQVKASVHGRADTAMQKQTRRYLKLLFERLDTNTCPGDVISKLSKMINLVDKRLYLKANDEYLQLCIGNLPWPVGCTSTGIHERTGRNRITESNIAHVMNDENTRKFLQAFKRIMTFKQGIFPNSDRSKNVG